MPFDIGGGGDAESIKGLEISNFPNISNDVLKFDELSNLLKFVDGDIGRTYVNGGAVNFSLETFTLLRSYNFIGRAGKKYMALIAFPVKSNVAGVDVEIQFNCLVNGTIVKTLVARTHCPVADEFYMASAMVLNATSFISGLCKIYTNGRVATPGSGASIWTGIHNYCPIEV